MDRSRGLIERRILYDPLPTQRSFHSSTARFKGLSGPVGTGKSAALCHEALRLSYLNPGRTGLLGAPTFPMLRDATQASLLRVLQENGIPYELNKGENVLTLGDCGSRIVFRSTDEFDRLRGTNLAWFGVDELTYTFEEAWIRLEARLRDPTASMLAGFAVWTPRGFDWVYKRFVQRQVAGYETFFAKPFENRYLLDAVPDYYDRLKASYDGKFFAQEVLGEYLAANAGRVYGDFDRTRHVQASPVDRTKPLYWSLDFNVDPHCSIVGQVDGQSLRIVDEIVLRRARTIDACREFVKRFPDHPAGVKILGDASGNRMQTGGDADYFVIREHLLKERYPGVVFETSKANPAVRDRVAIVNFCLRGSGTVEIDSRCRELITDLEQVVYRDDTGAIDKERDGDRTHLSDALGYLVWHKLRPLKSPVATQHRLF